MRAGRPEAAEEAFSLAEKLCREADSVPLEGAQGGSPCPGEVRREIDEHLVELRKKFPSPVPPPALIK
jgi:hypothetical protein